MAALVALAGQAAFLCAYQTLLAEHYARRARREAIAERWTRTADLSARSLALDPHQGYAAFFLGLAEQRRGRLDRAAEAFRRALATMPHRARPLLHLAECEEKLGRPDAAVDHLVEALALVPRPPGGAATPRARLGRLLYGRGRWADGLAQFRAVTADSADSRFHFQGLAAGYMHFGLADAATAITFGLLGSPALAQVGCKQLAQLARAPARRKAISAMLDDLEKTLRPDDPRRGVIVSLGKRLAAEK